MVTRFRRNQAKDLREQRRAQETNEPKFFVARQHGEAEGPGQARQNNEGRESRFIFGQDEEERCFF